MVGMQAKKIDDAKHRYKLADGTWSTEYRVGDRFVKFECLSENVHSHGSIIELYRDDGSGIPLFKTIAGECIYRPCDGQSGCFERWSTLISEFTYRALVAQGKFKPKY